MTTRILPRTLVLIVLALTAQAQSSDLSATVQEFVRVRTPKVVLTHVRVIDGTGGPAVEDRNVVIENGKITGIQAGATLVSHHVAITSTLPVLEGGYAGVGRPPLRQQALEAMSPAGS